MNADLALDSMGILSGKLIFTREGYDALESRNEYQQTGIEGYGKKVLANSTWHIEKSKLENQEDVDRPFIERYEVSISSQSTKVGKVMYINPYVALKEERNPFVPDNRLYPIDLGTMQERTLICNITIPDGYRLDELPQSKVIRFEDNAIKCTFNFSQIGSRVSLVSSFQINKAIFNQVEYGGLKDFYSRMIAKMNEQIVLKKIK